MNQHEPHLVGHFLLVVTALLSGCERAEHTSPVVVVEDLLRAVRCRLSDGHVACAGDNTHGIVRDPPAAEVVSEYVAITVPERVQSISMQPLGRRVCVLTTPGKVFCWGDSTDGTLGNGENPPSNPDDDVNVITRPAAVVGITGAIAIGMGVVHACALTKDGAVSCWGVNERGQLGVDGVDSSGTPVRTVVAAARVIAVAAFQTCAILENSRVTCWGDELPDRNGTYRPIPVPTEIPDVDDAVSLAVDRDQMCITEREGDRHCWNSVKQPSRNGAQ